MISKQHKYGAVTLVAVVAVLLVMGSMMPTVVADDHQNADVTYNTTESDSVIVSYTDIVGISGDRVDSDRQYVIEDVDGTVTPNPNDLVYSNGENTIVLGNESFSGDQLLLDTQSVFERFVNPEIETPPHISENVRDPRGDYEIRYLKSGEVQISDQHPDSPTRSLTIIRTNGDLTDVSTPQSGVELEANVSVPESDIDGYEWVVSPDPDVLNETEVLVSADDNTGNLDGYYDLSQSNVKEDSLSVTTGTASVNLTDASQGVIRLLDDVNEADELGVSYDYTTGSANTTEEIVGSNEMANDGDTRTLNESYPQQIDSFTLRDGAGNDITSTTNIEVVLNDNGQAVIQVPDGQNESEPLVAENETLDVTYTYDTTSAVNDEIVVSNTELGFDGFYQVSEVGDGLTQIFSPSGVVIDDSATGIVEVQQSATINSSSDFDLSYQFSLPDTQYSTKTITHNFQYDVNYSVSAEAIISGETNLFDSTPVPTNTEPTTDTDGQNTVIVDTVSANTEYVVAVRNVQDDGSLGNLVGVSPIIPAENDLNSYGIQNLEQNLLDDTDTSLDLSNGDEVAVVLHETTSDVETTSSPTQFDQQVDLAAYDNLGQLVGDLPVLNEERSVENGITSEAVSDTASLDTDAPTLTNADQVSQSSEGELFRAGWTLAEEYEQGELNDKDQRVYIDRLDIDADEPKGPTGIPVGSELVIAGSSNITSSDTLFLQPEAEDRQDDFQLEVEVTESPTVNEYQAVIDTALERVENPGDLEGRFELVDENENVVFSYRTTEQTLEGEFNPSFINLNTPDNTAELNLTSSSIGYDVLVESSQLSAEEMVNEPGIFADSEMDRIEIVDENTVRINNIDGVPETIDMNLDGISAGDYGLDISVAGSGASTQVEFTAGEGPEGAASFSEYDGTGSQKTFVADQGDRARIGVDMVETETVTFEITSQDYNTEFDARLESGEDSFDIVMDTYIADGEDAFGNDVNATDVFQLQGAEFVSEPELPPIDGPLATGLYSMEVRVDGTESDIGTLVIENRETRGLNTWVMPQGTESTLDNVANSATQQDNVARGDMLVVEVDATGFDSSELINDDTDPSALVNYEKRVELDPEYDSVEEMMNDDKFVERVPEINLEIEGDAHRNRPEPYMLVENAERIETEVGPDVDNRFFLFFDLSDDTVFENFNENHNLQNLDDELTDYDINLNYTEDYKYVDSNENDANAEDSMEVHERHIRTDMNEVIVDGESRYELEQGANSTILGDTHIAPGTELSVIVRDDPETDTQQVPFRNEVDVTVENNPDGRNTVSGTMDLSGLESGRNMTLRFFPTNDAAEPAIIGEERVAPQISNITFESSGDSPRVGDQIQFTAEVENASTALEYDWSFGDGESTSGTAIPSVTHTYGSENTYTVDLEVTDPSTGLSDTASTEVIVTPVPVTAPEIAEVSIPQELTVGETGQFAVVATHPEKSADELDYEWRFGDGSTSTEIAPEHSYSVEDTYEVVVEVSNPDGEDTSVTESQIVTVVPQQDNDDDNNDDEPTGSELDISVVDGESSAGIPGAVVEIRTESGDQIGQPSETDSSGNYTAQDLEDGNYAVEVTAEGYEDARTPVVVPDDSSVTIEMTPESNNNGNQNNGNGDGSPDQPGFTLIIAAVGLVAAGGYIYYRREYQS